MEPTADDLLASEADNILAAGAVGTSPRLRELFEFLRGTTLSNTPVKEFDIAHEVFGRDSNFDAVQDASVRVHVHRLRRKLEDHYAAFPPVGPRLAIPKGEYRLALIGNPAAQPVAAQPEAVPVDTPARPAAKRARSWAAGAILAALLVGAAGGWWYGARDNVDTPARQAAATSLWSGLSHRHSTPLLVLGDYYIFGEGTSGGGVESLTRRFDVNDGDDLHALVERERAPQGRYVDLNLYYLPAGTAWAMRDVIPLLRVLATGPRYAPVVPMSQLQPQMVKSSDLVYVGYLSGLGRLRNAVFAGSRLAIGSSYDELVDRRSGRHFNVDYGTASEPQQLHRELSYLSTFPGPDGNRIVVIAGSRDAGLIQASTVARDPAALADIQHRLGGAANFEVLFEVEAATTVPYRSKMVLAAPLDVTRPWREPAD